MCQIQSVKNVIIPPLPIIHYEKKASEDLLSFN